MLLVAASRIRGWMIQVALATGTLLVTRAVILSHDAVSFYAVWYIWIGLYAFYFCSRAVAALQVLFAAALYGVTLVNQVPSSPVARWLTTVATLVVAGAFIDTLLRRARQQATAASTSARSMTQVTALAHELAAVSDGAAARRALCVGAIRVTHADQSAFWEPEGDDGGLCVTATGSSEPGLAVPPAGARVAFESGHPASNIEVADDQEAVVLIEGSEDPGMTRLWYPIAEGEKVVAVLDLAWKHPSGVGPSVIALTKLLAAETALTLQRVALFAELQSIAHTDELTGLPNRRAWQERLAQEMARLARSRETLWVAMLDLDHFKEYNDAHGHQTGDRFLKYVASAWSGQLRPPDVLSRYGGEEFALALIGCAAEEAWATVERLRAAMPDGQTCSAGIASWDGVEPPVELLERADQALYTAKRHGRNQSARALERAGAARVVER